MYNNPMEKKHLIANDLYQFRSSLSLRNITYRIHIPYILNNIMFSSVHWFLEPKLLALTLSSKGNFILFFCFPRPSSLSSFIGHSTLVQNEIISFRNYFHENIFIRYINRLNIMQKMLKNFSFSIMFSMSFYLSVLSIFLSENDVVQTKPQLQNFEQLQTTKFAYEKNLFECANLLMCSAAYIY